MPSLPSSETVALAVWLLVWLVIIFIIVPRDDAG